MHHPLIINLRLRMPFTVRAIHPHHLPKELAFCPMFLFSHLFKLFFHRWRDGKAHMFHCWCRCHRFKLNLTLPLYLPVKSCQPQLLDLTMLSSPVLWKEYHHIQEAIMQKTSALSFKDLKQRISIEQVLRHYNLFDGLRLKGKSHRGPCPFCGEKESPFSVSLEKNCFQCFVCHVSGNILDMVMKLEGMSLREAGQFLNRTFVDGTASHEPAKTIQQEAPPVVDVEEADTKIPVAIAPPVAVSDSQQNELPTHNEPLTFALKHIESDHSSVKALGIREDTITAFGV